MENICFYNNFILVFCRDNMFIVTYYARFVFGVVGERFYFYFVCGFLFVLGSDSCGFSIYKIIFLRRVFEILCIDFY